MSWCRRCGAYELFNSCRCEMLGRVWIPDGGETESDAREIWGTHRDIEAALQRWKERKDSNSCEYSDDPTTVAFRPPGEPRQPVQYYTLRMEMVPSYHCEVAEDDEREDARKQQAKTLRSQRRYERERRARLAAQAKSA